MPHIPPKINGLFPWFPKARWRLSVLAAIAESEVANIKSLIITEELLLLLLGCLAQTPHMRL